MFWLKDLNYFNKDLLTIHCVFDALFPIIAN